MPDTQVLDLARRADQAIANGELLHRDLTATTIRAAVDSDSDAREFSAIGVPYGVVIEHYFGRETFDPGSVEGSDQAKLLYGHRDVIGRVLSGQDVDAGHQVDARVSDTTLGRDVWTLVRDGAIDKMSIGFEPIEYRVEVDDEGTETIHWTKVRAREFSLVPFPAYDGAAVDASSLRSRPERTAPMTTDALTREDLTPLEDSLEDLQRSVQLLGANPATTGPAAQWRSMGAFLKALASGDTAAADFHREYTGATTADTVMKDTFVGEYIKLVQDRRRIINRFTTAPLPAEGLSVDYVKLKSDDTKVERQVNEGDDLAYGKVQLEPASAPVHTYGGWTELSLQLIQRATIPTLDTTLRAMGLKYAAVTDAAVSTAFRGLEVSRSDAAIALGPDATADAWLDAIVDVAIAFEDAGFAIGGLLLTPARFKQLLHLKDGDRRLMRTYGDGVNQVGELNLSQVAGNLSGVRVDATKKVTDGGFYDPVAIEFRESPGAPAQLQDENIINLTKQFSIYGFASVLTPFPNAVIPITTDA